MNTVTRNEKPQSHVIIELIECLPDAVQSKTIMKKSNNNVDLVTFKQVDDKEKHMVIESSLFETYAMVVEGKLNLIVNGTSKMMHAGQGISLPAFNTFQINSKDYFKVVLTTIIRGGY